jgi:hypothetical protein
MLIGVTFELKNKKLFEDKCEPVNVIDMITKKQILPP